MISKSRVFHQRRRGPLILLLLFCAARLQALHFSTFVVPSSLPEQRVASGPSQHVAKMHGHMSPVEFAALRQRQQSSLIRTARGGGLISWLRGRIRRNKVPATDAEASTPAQEETLVAETLGPAASPAPTEGDKQEDELHVAEKEVAEPVTKKEAGLMADAPKEAETVQPSEEEEPVTDKKVGPMTAAAKEAEAVQPSGASAGSTVPMPDVAAADPEASVLLSAFQAFDLDGSGKIDRQELESAALRLGKSTDQIGTMLTRFSERGDYEIDFGEFQMLIEEMEEGCDVENEECFMLEDPSTWGKLFEFKFD